MIHYRFFIVSDVEDGFEIDNTASKTKSMSLRTMRKQASAMGASFKMKSEISKWAKIYIEISKK